MPLDFNVVKTNLYSWASAVVPNGMPIIFYEPNAPRPVVPYVSLYMTSIITVNQDYSSPESDLLGFIDMKGDRQFTLQIQCYGSDPLTVLENMRISLQKQTILDTLRENGIVFYQSISITDISALIDSEYEKRAQMDVLLGIGQTYSDNPGYFDTIEIEEEIHNVDDVIIFDETFQVPQN